MPVIRDQYISANVTPEVLARSGGAKGEDVLKVAPDDVRQRAFAIAFQFPAWLMVLSLAVFALGKPFYAKETRDHHVLTPEDRPLQWQTLGRLFSIFALIVLFWFGYEHNDSLWVDFTSANVDLRVAVRRHHDRPGPAPIPECAVRRHSGARVQLSCSASSTRRSKVITAMRKILAGFLLTAAAVGIMSLAGFLVEWHRRKRYRSSGRPPPSSY